jgi:hypothetical protein
MDDRVDRAAEGREQRDDRERRGQVAPHRAILPPNASI